MCLDNLKINQRSYIIISLIQDFEADFLWKVSLKILNLGLILNTFNHDISTVPIGPQYDKTYLRGFRKIDTQTSLLSDRD